MVHFSLFLIGFFFLGTSGFAPPTPAVAQTNKLPFVVPPEVHQQVHQPTDVPFFSQFTDISSPKWQKVGCGIASLGMIIEYYKPGTVSVDTLLADGLEQGAYSDAGWTYKGLIGVSSAYGFTGESHDLAGNAGAFTQFKDAVRRGPVIASVYYTFEPGNPIPHLVVVTKIEGDTVYYNDPAEREGGGTISVDAFTKAWKKRYIEIYPIS